MTRSNYIFLLSMTLLASVCDISGQATRLNIDSLLAMKDNDYLMEFKDGELSLCCYQIFSATDRINYKMFSISTEEYHLEDGTKIVNVYRSDSSFVKIFQNDHPQVNRLDLVSGKIFSNKLLIKSTVTIGMMKASFLSTIFEPSKLYDAIKSVTIYENELGEAKTIFIFSNDKLSEILFDSSYDWVKKEL